MRLHHLATALLAGAALACGDSGGVDRSDRYGYIIVNNGDTLAFHWNASDLPVRIWVEDVADLPAHIQRGINLWQGVLGSGQYNAVVVTDSTTAKVIVRGQSIDAAPSLIPTGNSGVACQGVTIIDTVASEHQLAIPIRINLEILGNPGSDSVQSCLRRVVAHELGHSLGLFQHSPNSGDLMFTFPEVDAPSARDANTVITLYSVTRNMVPVRRPAAAPLR